MRTPQEPYNPLDTRRLAASVVQALLEQPQFPLPPAEPFLGVGIYVIYYTGDFPPYRPVAEQTRRAKEARHQRPIYVGKAVPEGRSTGRRVPSEPSTPLYSRLQEHLASINEASNLAIADFFCRFLNVEQIWIPLAESLLIAAYKPLWNVVVKGFGNHDPGRESRAGQRRSAWDELHPGRSFAAHRAPHRRTRDQLLALIEKFLESEEVAEQLTAETLSAEDDSGVV